MITITYDMIDYMHFDHPDGIALFLHGDEYYGPNTRGREWDITDAELALYGGHQFHMARLLQDSIRIYLNKKGSLLCP
jgi:hypothetical protein